MALASDSANNAASNTAKADGYIVRARIDGQRRYVVDYICELTPWAYIYDVQCNHFLSARSHARLRATKSQSPCMRHTCAWRWNAPSTPKELMPTRRVRAELPLSVFQLRSAPKPERPRRPAGEPRRPSRRPQLEDDPIKDGYDVARDSHILLPSDCSRPNTVRIRRAAVDDPQRLYFVALNNNEYVSDQDWEPTPDFHIDDIPCSEPTFTVRYARQKKGGKRKGGAATADTPTGVARPANSEVGDYELRSVVSDASAIEQLVFGQDDDVYEFVIVDEDDLRSMAGSWIDLDEELGDNFFSDT